MRGKHRFDFKLKIAGFLDQLSSDPHHMTLFCLIAACSPETSAAGSSRTFRQGTRPSGRA